MPREYLPGEAIASPSCSWWGGDTGLERRCACPHLTAKWGQFCFYSSSPATLAFSFLR